MAIIEKLGSFYLGNEYDLEARKLSEVAVNYDARDLTTHAVCVGMTGSGKTGLCICLLEEAALDGVPAIMIDPKGDITNLLLTFPELRPEDFLPWVNPDDARRKGQTEEEYAAKTAQTWREGLASWGQGPERIRMLKAAADFVIYTPGSEAGLPVSMLSSFKAPALDWDTETETLRDQIQGTVSALLGLAGIEADPVRSREHILLSNILENAWRGGEDLDLARLIASVQKPPFRQVGVLDVDTFYPEKDRFNLAMTLNNIIASPSLAAWLKGDPLDIPSLLYTPEGKPRHSIFYIAHLSDAERMFFVTILLEQVIAWMRSQPGTTSLRALLYMDEVFGFFPPTANPPSKRPMLTLLKQARAFGLGVVLTTQNPVDLDYKGLTNTGTWFIGKLQAERDKARLLDGLEGALSSAGVSTDRRALDKMISALDSRIFLLHNVHQKGPVVLHTRWAMSYLRGPLTRQQIKELMAGRKAAPQAVSRPVAGRAHVPAGAPTGPVAAPVAPVPPAGLSPQPPVVPPGVRQVFLPLAKTERDALRAVAERVGGQVTPTERRLIYEPALLGMATVHFVDRKLNLDESLDYALLLPVAQEARLLSWRDARPVDVHLRDLQEREEPDALFAGGLPQGYSSARAFSNLETELVDYLYRSEAYALAYNRTLKLYARTGESERNFRARCQQAAREARDKAVDALKEKYKAKFRRLEERLAREEQRLAEYKATYKSRILEEGLSGLASVAGFLGIGGSRSRSLGKLATAATKRRMTTSAKMEIEEAEAAIARIKAEDAELKAELEREANELTEYWSKAGQDIEEIKVMPRKTDIKVQLVALAWAPAWEITYEDLRGRVRVESVPAYQGISQA
ncbi:MAG: ATP-binding protein [Anaerolineae bacterium]